MVRIYIAIGILMLSILFSETLKSGIVYSIDYLMWYHSFLLGVVVYTLLKTQYYYQGYIELDTRTPYEKHLFILRKSLLIIVASSLVELFAIANMINVDENVIGEFINIEYVLLYSLMLITPQLVANHYSPMLKKLVKEMKDV